MNKSIATNYAKIAREYLTQAIKAVAKEDAKAAVDAFAQAAKHMNEARTACGD